MDPSGSYPVLALITAATNATLPEDPIRNGPGTIALACTERSRDLGFRTAAFAGIRSERCGSHVRNTTLYRLWRVSLHCERYAAAEGQATKPDRLAKEDQISRLPSLPAWVVLKWVWQSFFTWKTSVSFSMT